MSLKFVCYCKSCMLETISSFKPRDNFSLFLISMTSFLLLLLASCDTQPNQPKPINPAKLKKPLMEANKDLVELEEFDIEGYINRHNWPMTETGSGLRYWVYENGTGEQAAVDKIIEFNYKVELLNGFTCYDSDSLGSRQFLIGRGGVESGLEEAVLHFREGDRAKIILPSHLAFGLVGDDNCIPKKAVVVYDFEVLSINNPTNRN